jgi:hypothetical protein
MQPPQRARHDDLPHFAHDRARTAGTTAEELYTLPFCGLDHPFRLGQADGHRLFDNDVLAALGGQDDVWAVARIGCGNPDGIDVRIVAQRLDRGVGLDSICRLEQLERSWVDVGASHQVNMGHGHHG